MYIPSDLAPHSPGIEPEMARPRGETRPLLSRNAYVACACTLAEVRKGRRRFLTRVQCFEYLYIHFLLNIVRSVAKSEFFTGVPSTPAPSRSASVCHYHRGRELGWGDISVAPSSSCQSAKTTASMQRPRLDDAKKHLGANPCRRTSLGSSVTSSLQRPARIKSSLVR
jgi:hypothetical protein